MIKKENNQKTGLIVILLVAFLIAQEITWDIIAQWLNWGEKPCLILHVQGLLIYTFLCIWFTKDRFYVENFNKKHPRFHKLFSMLLDALTHIFVWISKIPNLMSEISDGRSIKEEVMLTKRKVKEEENKYNQYTAMKSVVAIGGFIIELLILSFILSIDAIRVICDVINTILNIVLFCIVCANIDNLDLGKT